jgi:ribose transport system permease protein
MKLGRRLYAYGGNPIAARLSGVQGTGVQLFVYVLAGAMAALSGVIVSGLVTSGQPTGATGFNLDVIAAVVVGGTSLFGGRGTLVGTMLGALFIAILGNGLTLLNVQSYWQEIVRGAVIASAVMLDGYVARRSS